MLYTRLYGTCKEKISMQVHVVKGVLIYAHTHTQVHVVLRILINLWYLYSFKSPLCISYGLPGWFCDRSMPTSLGNGWLGCTTKSKTGTFWYTTSRGEVQLHQTNCEGHSR